MYKNTGEHREALPDMVMRSTELIERIVRTGVHIPSKVASEMQNDPRRDEWVHRATKKTE